MWKCVTEASEFILFSIKKAACAVSMKGCPTAKTWCGLMMTLRPSLMPAKSEGVPLLQNDEPSIRLSLYTIWVEMRISVLVNYLNSKWDFLIKNNWEGIRSPQWWFTENKKKAKEKQNGSSPINHNVETPEKYSLEIRGNLPSRNSCWQLIGKRITAMCLPLDKSNTYPDADNTDAHLSYVDCFPLILHWKSWVHGWKRQPQGPMRIMPNLSPAYILCHIISTIGSFRNLTSSFATETLSLFSHPQPSLFIMM